MKPLFAECFEDLNGTTKAPEWGPIDPLLWVMIALAVIGALLSIAVWLMLERRERIIKQQLEDMTCDPSVSSSDSSIRPGKFKGLSLLDQFAN